MGQEAGEESQDNAEVEDEEEDLSQDEEVSDKTFVT